MDTVKENILFPLSSRYDPEWIKNNSLGENVLYNLESLFDALEIIPGMKVLDLGCGKAVSAIFLAKEFGVKVWAVDPKICPGDNLKRAQEMEVGEEILPLKLDARNLPFPNSFFDLIIAVDSFMYFGTDMEFTNYISGFLKTGGQIGIVDICFTKEIGYMTVNDQQIPNVYKENLSFVHSLNWWYKLWHTSGVLNVEVAEIVPENNFIKEEYIKDYRSSGRKDIIAEELSKDSENVINIFRMVARKNEKDYKLEYWLQ